MSSSRGWLANAPTSCSQSLSERWPARRRQGLHLPGPGPPHKQGQVTGGRVGQPPCARFQQRDRHRRELAGRHGRGHPAQLGEQPGRLVAGDGQRAPGASDLRHVRGGGDPVPGDVADGEISPALLQEQARV